MSPDELDKARVKEAVRWWEENPNGRPCSMAEYAARLAREGWTPPPKVSPRVLAAEEYASTVSDFAGEWVKAKKDFLAGFAAAVKLAEPLVEVASRVGMLANAATHLSTYRQSIGDTPHEGQ